MLTQPLGDVATRAVGSLLWLTALLAFLAVGVGIQGQQAWWRTLAVAGAVVSLVALALFVDRRPTQPALNAALFDGAVLVALLVLKWPPSSLVGP